MSDAIDPAEILAALEIPSPEKIVPVQRGLGDSAIWRVEIPDPEPHTYALRLFPAGHEAMLRREHAAMSAAGRQRLPVPFVHAARTVLGRPVMLLDWCPGTTLYAELMTHPNRAWALGVMLGTAQGRLHLTRATPDLHQHGRDWIGWCGAEEVAIQERLRAVLSRGSDQATILHLDFHPLNVMVGSRKVTGIIDWANAGAGDHRADVARTATILRHAPIPPEVPRRQVIQLRRVFRRGWRHGYARITGPLADMAIFNAWALAVMVRDLSPNLDRPSSGITEADLEPIRAALAAAKAKLDLAD